MGILNFAEQAFCCKESDRKFVPILLRKIWNKMSVYLVGAGPGDPDLLTTGAHRAIENADLVIADRLVSQQILALVKCDLKISTKNTKRGDADQAQADLDAWGIEAVKKGKVVVRLKNGDPFVFGRGGEEMAIYHDV